MTGSENSTCAVFFVLRYLGDVYSSMFSIMNFDKYSGEVNVLGVPKHSSNFYFLL